MSSWYPEGNNPTSHDTEVVSLQKIVSLLNIWASNIGAAPSIPWFPQTGPATAPYDQETESLQKTNAILLAIKAAY